jgi:cytochrome c oxidase assembly factor CtaG
VSPYDWELRPQEGLVIVLLAAAYVLVQRFYPASRPRRVCFGLSLLLLLVAFETPLETIGLHYLLTGHLLQNVILAEWAPALAVAGLSPALAREIGRARAVRVLTYPLVALPIWLVNYFAWHLPPIYDYALRHNATILHFEHASYFVTGALMWWPVLHDSPWRLSSGIKAGYLFGAFVLASPIGLLLALVGRPVYHFYAGAPERLWGMSRLTDQQLAGMTMAAEQAVVFFAVFAVYFLRFFDEEDRLTVTSDSR